MTCSVVVFQVDVFGACGKLTCTRDDEDACFNMLKKDYKFYLAFENSNCQYYITEKFFRNALMYVFPLPGAAWPINDSFSPDTVLGVSSCFHVHPVDETL